MNMVNMESTILGATRGLFLGFDAVGEPLVDFPVNPFNKPVPAITTVPLSLSDVNREIVLLFEDFDLTRPIVIGVRQGPNSGQAGETREGGDVKEGVKSTRGAEDSPSGSHSEHLVFTAHKELVLSCGKASIILTRSGKVLIRGEYILSRSSGANCIKGGSVRIN